MDHQEENEIPNVAAAHYENPNLNAFHGENLTIRTIKENARIWLSFPVGLRKHAIQNIMKIFGHIIKIDGPFDANKNGNRTFAFIEYKTFKEAERALREINELKTAGLEFRADFARVNSLTNENSEIPIVDSPPEEVPEDLPQTAFNFDLNKYIMEDPFEKVSFFEYDRVKTVDIEDNELMHIKVSAAKSLGKYNEKEKVFEYNMRIRDYNFLTYFCYVCESEAQYFHDEYQKYFCTKDCFNNFMTKSENEVKHYKVQKSEKVSITAVINERCLYVKPSKADLHYILESVYRKSKNCEPLKVIPEIGEDVLVAAFASFYRAKVLEVHDDCNQDIHLVVRLTDIGNTLKVNVQDVFEMTPACSKIEVITTKLMLKNVIVEAMNMDVINYLLNLKNSDAELTVMDLNEDGADLKDPNNILLNEKISQLANFDKVTFSDSNSLTPVDDLIKHTDQQQKFFVVKILNCDGNNGYVCIAEKYFKDFCELYRSLNLYGSKVNQEDYGIYNDVLSMVKYNDKWHRAYVNETKGDGKPQCVLIDLQITCNVEIERIFKLPNALSQFPIMTEIYEIDGYSKDEEIKKYCDENISENDFIIANKVEIKDDFPILHLSMPNSK